MTADQPRRGRGRPKGTGKGGKRYSVRLQPREDQHVTTTARETGQTVSDVIAAIVAEHVDRAGPPTTNGEPT